MLGRFTDKLMRPISSWLEDGHMRRLGIANTMRLARGYYRLTRGRQHAWRKALYQNGFHEFLRQHGELKNPTLEMNDGWVIDRSMTLPHLDRLLADAETIIDERSGVRRSTPGTYRSFFQNLTTVADAQRFPSLLDFPLSPDVVRVVANYLKCVPALSTVHPEAIRFVESYAGFDDQPDKPHDSQLFHIDYYSNPNVYVIVLLSDTTEENGPFKFLPASTSRRVAEQLRYWTRGKPYRLTDEEVYSIIDPKEVITLDGPKGAVLFIDPSSCMHYGSRNSIKPRYQLMYGFTSAIRTDLGEFYLEQKQYPVTEGDSRLRKIMLDRHYVD